MAELTRFALDQRGEACVREHLTGVNTLCTELLSVFESARGEVFTYAPTAVAGDWLYAFETGGMIAANRDLSRAIPVEGRGLLMPVETLIEARAEHILQRLKELPGGVCVIDDYNPRWGDPLHGGEATAFGVGEEVYHLVTAASGFDQIADVLGWGDTIWHGAAAICRPDHEPTRAELSSPEGLRALARTAVEISCTAYDREGFVNWRRIDR
ncbi:hypothetical protein [Caulobacter sp. 17J65-9]|uniref:hypothetical protein n=1 Tax=Caulobacter sp. 17J65-9 TaxID=2709382 RepID=UPI0013CDA85C|nr:hypothetical protein [Caulobacter sp. 17J65-9]NEX92280.1 hypothetical protein [Caulobacter sp. 17J65-9]